MLKDPIQRAKYILGMYGVDLESHQLNDSGLLMEIMELQEKIGDISDKGELETEIEGFRSTMEKSLEEADDLLKHGDAYLEPITALVIRAQYFQKLMKNAERVLSTM